MARELWDSHVRARRSCVFRALHMMYAQAPGQLRASRTSTRGVEAFIFQSGRSARIWYLGGGGGGDHESSRCLPSTQQAGSEPYQRGWAVGACVRSEVAHGSAAHTSIPTRCKSVRHLCTNMDAPVCTGRRLGRTAKSPPQQSCPRHSPGRCRRSEHSPTSPVAERARREVLAPSAYVRKRTQDGLGVNYGRLASPPVPIQYSPY